MSVRNRHKNDTIYHTFRNILEIKKRAELQDQNNLTKSNSSLDKINTKLDK